MRISAFRFLALKELCQYLQPKLRSIELTGDPAHPLHLSTQVKITLSRALEKTYGAQEHRHNGHAPHFGIAAAPANGR